MPKMGMGTRVKETVRRNAGWGVSQASSLIFKFLSQQADITFSVTRFSGVFSLQMDEEMR